MKDGRRLLALQRLASVGPNLASAEYVASLSPEQRKSDAAFEAAWKKAGRDLAADLRPPSPSAFEGVAPAAVRGVAEASLAQVRVFYDASLVYERSTMPDSGYFYLGLARAQHDFAEFCRGLSKPSGSRPPPLRSLAPELDALEGELLAAYRPPASIDRHSDFIAASATLKEARELDSAGLANGAMLRYLQAALRCAPLTGKAPAITKEEAARRLAEFELRLVEREGGLDQSLGRIFLEAGQADVAAAAASGEPPAQASAVVHGVLPRYFAALEPARAAREAAGRGRHRHARPLAVHLKPLRPGKFAGAERGAGVRRPGALRLGELRRLGAREALRRHALSRDLRGRCPRRDAQRLRLLRQGREGRGRPLRAAEERGGARTFPGRPDADDRAPARRPQGGRPRGRPRRARRRRQPPILRSRSRISTARRSAPRISAAGSCSSSSGRRGARPAAERSAGSGI